MTALFGTKYFGFILSAYGITAAVLIVLDRVDFHNPHPSKAAIGKA